MKKCAHCKLTTVQCFEHCHKTEDGKHVPDPYCLVPVTGIDWLLDTRCKLCGCSGSVCVDPSDIRW